MISLLAHVTPLELPMLALAFFAGLVAGMASLKAWQSRR